MQENADWKQTGPNNFFRECIAVMYPLNLTCFHTVSKTFAKVLLLSITAGLSLSNHFLSNFMQLKTARIILTILSSPIPSFWIVTGIFLLFLCL